MAELELPETMHIEESHEEETRGTPNPRDAIMKTIAERAERVRQDELAQAKIYDDDARAAGLVYEEDTPEEPEPRAEPEVVEAAHAPVETPKPALQSVTFEGRQFDVTPEQYAQLAQMGMLANVALHNYQQQPAPPQPIQEAPAKQEPQSMVDPELVRETVRRIQYGGEQEGAEALARLVADVVQRVPTPTIDQNHIIQQAAQVAQQQSQFAHDAQIIQSEYRDVFADPQRTMLARLNVDAIRQRNTAMGKYATDLEIFREAGNMVLDALSLPRPNTQDDFKPAIQAATVASRPDVIERKRAAPRHSTTQVIDRRAPQPSTPRAPSGADIVDQMRKARGQASMM